MTTVPPDGPQSDGPEPDPDTGADTGLGAAETSESADDGLDGGAPGDIPPGVAPGYGDDETVAIPRAYDATQVVPTVPPPPIPPPGAPGKSSPSPWIWAVVAIVVLAIVLVVLALMNDDDDSDEDPSASSTTTSSTSTTSTTVPTTTTTAAAPTTTAESTTTTAPPGPAPTITKFDVPASVSCNAPTQVELSWATRNTTSVTIEIDGLNVSSQAPTGTDLFAFPCDGEPHDYTLIAKGTGETTETRTVQQEQS